MAMRGRNHRAYIVRDHQDFLRRTVRLLLAADDGPGRVSYWKGDDTWETVNEGVTPSEPAGVLLPIEAVGAIYEAITEFEGKQNHGATEAKVLREWLEVERGRVDRVLGA